MNGSARFMAFSVCLLTCCLARGAVVINEIFYGPPDDIPKLQWIELHNPDSREVDLSRWNLVGGATFNFPEGSRLQPNGFAVLCQDAKRFGEYYKAPVLGEFEGSLTRSGRRVELLDAAGRTVDRVKFEEQAPWPVAADGCTASLERISPGTDGMLPSNWTASPLSDDETWPSGSPGARNHNYCGHLPPVIRSVTFAPTRPKPGESIEVEAQVQAGEAIESVELCYQVVQPGQVSNETIVRMRSLGQNRYGASIPPREKPTLLRFRVRASDAKGGERSYPAATELRPSLSVYVQAPPEMSSIPLAQVINTDPRDVANSGRYIQHSKADSDHPFRSKHGQALQMLISGLDQASAWTELTVQQSPEPRTFEALRKVFAERAADRQKLIEEVIGSEQIDETVQKLPGRIAALQREWTSEIVKLLPPDSGEAFARWANEQVNSQQRGPESFFKQLVKIEGAWLALNLRFELDEASVTALRPILKKALEGRSLRNPELQALSPGPEGFPKLQAAFGKVENLMWAELRQVLSFPQMSYAQQWLRDNGSFIRPRLTAMRAVPPRGPSAFIVVDPETRVTEVFDFVNVTERSAGYKVRFHKDRRFRGMNTVNLMFEYNDRFVLAESLAYDLYRRVGSPSPDTDFVRLILDNRPIGYHLLTEQINGSFLRRQHRDPKGDLYKIAWYGRSIESQHEKQDRPETGHAELVDLIKHLNDTKGDAQWAVIEKNFNVPQVINYFAVNMCLSHWDGFFNNYFAYYDRKGSRKWEMYPWDQDKTWGYYDNIKPGEVFYNMPVTFGMEGDTPPGGGPARFDPSSWWRPGGFFSKPLLANPEFRHRFLARLREILKTHFTPEVLFPVMDTMADRLRPEVAVRAAALGEEESRAVRRLEENIAAVKENLVKRREFLLAQP
jgi:hypothetical protein